MSDVPSRSLSFADYCAIQGVNASVLKHAKTSGVAFLSAFERKLERVDTDPMRLGRAGHTLVFEPDLYRDLYTVWGESRRTKAWKEFRNHAKAEGKTILHPIQNDYAHWIADAVKAHPLAAWYLEGALYEQTLVWTDDQTEIICKGRTDALNVRRHALIDLKILADISERSVQQKIYGFGWVEAMAHYAAGTVASGIWVTPPDRIIIAAESKPPFEVGVFRLDGDSCAFGDETNRELLNKVAEWRKSGVYPGRYPDEKTIAPPRWVLPDEEEGATDDLIFHTEEEE